MSDKEVQEAYERAEKNYEKLKDRVHEQYFEIESLKLKIDKAIEYINKHFHWGINGNDNIDDLLNILQGKSDE